MFVCIFVFMINCFYIWVIRFNAFFIINIDNNKSIRMYMYIYIYSLFIYLHIMNFILINFKIVIDLCRVTLIDGI